MVVKIPFFLSSCLISFNRWWQKKPQQFLMFIIIIKTTTFLPGAANRLLALLQSIFAFFVAGGALFLSAKRSFDEQKSVNFFRRED
jgi:hypothetical protein